MKYSIGSHFAYYTCFDGLLICITAGQELSFLWKIDTHCSLSCLSTTPTDIAMGGYRQRWADYLEKSLLCLNAKDFILNGINNLFCHKNKKKSYIFRIHLDHPQQGRNDAFAPLKAGQISASENWCINKNSKMKSVKKEKKPPKNITSILFYLATRFHCVLMFQI